ncbi:MAG: hypothetical protein AAGA20_22700 [Planctomycetota bacterium]
MILPTLALALQGPFLQQVVDAHASESAQGLVQHALVQSGRDARVFGLDAAGQLVEVAPLEGPVGSYFFAPAVSGTRVIAPDYRPSEGFVAVRVWERGPSLWTRGPDLGLEIPPASTQRPPAVVDVDNDRSVVVYRWGGVILIHDLRTAGQATLEAAIPTGNRFAMDVAIDGDVVAVLDGELPIPNRDPVDLRVRLFEREPSGWMVAGELTPPTGVDLARSVVRNIDAHGGRIAIGAARGPVGDPGGRVFVYERAPGGSYVLDAVVRPTEESAIAPDRGTEFGYGVHLAGDELAITSPFHGVGQRFVRAPSGWIPRERVLAATYEQLYPFGGRLLGNRLLGDWASRPFLFQPVTSDGIVDVVCPALVSKDRSFVFVGGSETPVRTFRWAESAPTPPGTRFFLVGTTEARRPLGPAAELCVGPPFGVYPVALPPNSLSVALTLDLSTLGLSAGTTVYVQGWRRDPVDVGGLTTPGFSVTVPN